jgi:hypothetical protein
MRFKIEYKKNKMKGGYIGMNKKAAEELHIPFHHKHSNVIEIYKTKKPIMKHTEKHEEIEYSLMRKGMHYHHAHKIALKNEKRKEPLKTILHNLK